MKRAHHKYEAPTLPGILPGPMPPPPVIYFDGRTYDPSKDRARLETMLDRVRALMADNEPRTLGEIVAVVGGSEAGVSARLRDLRKPRFGSYIVRRRRRTERGLWEYWVERGSV